MTARLWPILAMLAAALLWGLWWVPIRELNALGLEGAWASIAMNLGAAPLLLLVVAFGGRSAESTAPVTAKALFGAALLGVAMTFYACSLAYTDVVRAVLLFYLAPAWSTLIEMAFMGRRFSWRSAFSIGLSLVGAIVIFRGDIGLSAWSIGDAMALLSGVAWSIGAALVFFAPAPGRRLAVATCLSAALVGLLLALIGGETLGAIPTVDAMLAAGPMAFATGAIYLAPVVLATLWGAQLLPPAVVSYLLTAEIISGVASAAVWLDEPFGAPEVIGTILVAAGALTEVIGTSGASNTGPKRTNAAQ